MILIYDDEGASNDSVRALFDSFHHREETRCVSGNDLQNNDWINKTKLLIMPGGRSLPFYKTIGQHGNNNITNFVKQGGCYLGLCAGAYYAANQTVFAEQLPLALQLPGELNFFPGRAVGPVFSDDLFAYQSESGAAVVEIDWHDNTAYAAYYNGGCYFEKAESFKNTQILATYQKNKTAAVIVCTVEKGRAILSGIHPELSFTTVPDDALQHHQSLRKQLIAINDTRLALWQRFITMIKT